MNERVAEADPAELYDEHTEARELFACKSRVFVRNGKVRADAGDLDARKRHDFPGDRNGVVLPHTEPAHTRVQ